MTLVLINQRFIQRGNRLLDARHVALPNVQLVMDSSASGYAMEFEVLRSSEPRYCCNTRLRGSSVNSCQWMELWRYLVELATCMIWFFRAFEAQSCSPLTTLIRLPPACDLYF